MQRNLTACLDNLRERLHSHKTTDVARASGVHVNTVRAIRNSVNVNPKIDTCTRLHQTLDSMEGIEND